MNSQVTSSALGRSQRVIVPPGVALQLISPSKLQLALDGHEPPGEPLRRRDRVPQVVDGRIVSADRHRNERGLAQVLAVFYAAKLCSEQVAHLSISCTLPGRPATETNISTC
jgi:hypothetical protein